jgi:hypothetical protein
MGLISCSLPDYPAGDEEVIEGVGVGGHKAVLVGLGVTVDEGNATTVLPNWQISDDLVLALHDGFVSLIVLTLRHCSHLYRRNVRFVPGKHVEDLIEVGLRGEEGVQVSTEDYVVMRLILLKLSQTLLETCNLGRIFTLIGTQMRIEEDNIVNNEE